MKKKKIDSKKWTKESVETEIEELQKIDPSQIKLKGLRDPKDQSSDKYIKRTHLDLTPYLLEKLDKEARKVGMNRQSLIKHYILNGLKEQELKSS